MSQTKEIPSTAGMELAANHPQQQEKISP